MTCAVPLPSLCPSPPHALGFFAKGLSFAHLSLMSSNSSFPAPGFDMAGKHSQRGTQSDDAVQDVYLLTQTHGVQDVKRHMMQRSSDPDSETLHLSSLRPSGRPRAYANGGSQWSPWLCEHAGRIIKHLSHCLSLLSASIYHSLALAHISCCLQQAC